MILSCERGYKMPRITVLFITFCWLLNGSSALQFMNADEILEYAENNINKVFESWQINFPQDLANLPEDRRIVRKRAEDQLIIYMNELSFRLDDMARTDITRKIMMKYSGNSTLSIRLSVLSSYIDSIDKKYVEMLRYIRKIVEADENELIRVAEKFVGHDSQSLHRNIYSIYNEFCRDVQNCLLSTIIIDTKETKPALCDMEQSQQQLMYNLYNAIALAEMKGYAMLQFSYNILRLHNKKNFTQEIKKLKGDYSVIVTETLKHVKIAMTYASHDIWRCDPNKHKEETTFTELKEVFQGYIVNEVDLNPQGTCRENCAFYTNTKVYNCYASQFCSKQKRCNGSIIKCQYIDSDMWICPAREKSLKRYNHISYENGKTFGGSKEVCPNQTKVDSWWRWLFWHCSYCFCYCDDATSNSDRYFNLRNVTSDIDSNKVVVGVRLRKVNHIVHMQIKEGTLLPKGIIDPESVKWKPVNNYTISQTNIKSGKDYHMINYQKRGLDLDDLVPVTNDQLLTGLRFRVVGTHLNLEIRTTPFDFESGKLFKDRSHWHSNDNTDASEHVSGRRTEVHLEKRDVPTRSKFSKSLPDSTTNQYLYFQPTDTEMDAAQSTIPFLDIQAVEGNPPTPISGAGIYHKGQQNSGGFIAMKLISYNFSRHLNANVKYNPVSILGLSNDINAV